MPTIKTQQKLSTLLYLVAIVLLIINIYNKGKDIDNRYIEIAAWSIFLLAAVYAGLVAKQKKNAGDKEQT